MIILDNKGNNVTNNKTILGEIGVFKCFITKDSFEEICKILNIISIDNVEKFTYHENKIEYYCVYVGLTKSCKGFFKRIVKQHIDGNVNVSTLRKSLKGILEKGNSNFKVKNILENKTIFIITPINNINRITKEKIDEINRDNFYRPLNLNDNYYYKKDVQMIKIKEAIKKARK